MADMLIAGPCSLESVKVSLTVAERMKSLCDGAGLTYIFKGSFDKANRTRIDSPRGTGLDQGLHILQRVRREIGCATITDVHEEWQVKPVASVVDVIQIPAMLSRQTDLIVAAARHASSGVMIKKGQAMDVEGLNAALNKVDGINTSMACLRGTAFGNGDLVMDFRDVVDLRNLGRRTIVDVTHGVMSKHRGMDFVDPDGIINDYSMALARAAVAVGACGVFAEIHPDPENAPSDRDWMLPLSRAEELVEAVAGQG